MSWILAYLLILILIVLAFWIGSKKDITSKNRFNSLGLLALPIPLYMLVTCYFTAYY